MVSVVIIVLLYMLKKKESYNSMVSMWLKLGVDVSYVSVGYDVMMVVIVMVMRIGLCLMWFDSVLLMGS